jgi:hypothetical protein
MAGHVVGRWKQEMRNEYCWVSILGDKEELHK